MKTILASGSPRRKELLSLITPKFEIIVSGVDESLKEGLTPEQQTERLAYIKAKDVFEKTSGDRIVIGSDTIVTKKGKIYGKPKSRENAIQMIKELLEGDRTHSVITGLSILIEKEVDEEKIFGNKKGIINIDTISRNFEAGDIVTVNSLKDKKLIDKNVCFVKVLARGIIDKPLIVKAQDFSLDAAKMIQLTGGKVVLLNKKKY